MLSSLNGEDKSQKRICKLNVHQQTWNSCSFDIICPQDKIPTPYPQSMKTFQDERSNRNRKYWVDDITEEDLNTLPIILLGLSDIKLFPIPTTEVAKKLTSYFPHIQFFKSKITGSSRNNKI